jgi:lysophospholipase L1-like esterase
MSMSLGQRARQIVLVLLAVAGLVAGTTPALAGESGGSSDSTRHGRTYLALGDSVPFGFIGNAPELYPNPRNFVGYPDRVADHLGLRLLNASCPGETTDSFIDVKAQSNGCENTLDSDIGYRDRFRLHVNYKGSQLHYAAETLDDGPRVRLVTLQFGANDLFVCLATGACATPAGVAALTAHVQANLDRILSTLRDEGEYWGRIAVVTYYALDYTDPAGVALIQAVNKGMIAAAEANKAVVADGFGAFRSRALQAGGSSIAAGLIYPNDVHPTAKGHRLLAHAVERAVGH